MSDAMICMLFQWLVPYELRSDPPRIEDEKVFIVQAEPRQTFIPVGVHETGERFTAENWVEYIGEVK